jgi:hypothetical protein
MQSDVDDADLDHLIVAGAVLGLRIRAEWRDAVRANLRASLAMAALVTALPLPDEAEPAPVFTA